MRKRIGKLVCLMMLFLWIMTGCGTGIPDMTEVEREAISEYAVELLLKYDTNDTSRLVDPSVLEKEPEPTKKPVPVATEPPRGMDETEDTPIIDLVGDPDLKENDIRDVLGLADTVAVEFVESRFATSYEDMQNAELVIEAMPGKELFLCEFVLVNDGAGKQSVDLLRKNIQYSLVADGATANCMITMLSNDLTTYMGILEPDESRKVLVLTELERSVVENASEVYLLIQSEEEQGIIKVK